MWTCPTCGARLVVRNLSHACGAYTVQGFLSGKSGKERALFRALVRIVQSCGPFHFAPAKTRVAFMVRIRFASVNGLTSRGMRYHLLLKRRVKSPRVVRVEKVGLWHVHHLQATEPADLDDQVKGWIRESYLLGS